MTGVYVPRIERRYGVAWIAEAWDLFKLAPLSWILGLLLAGLLNFAITFFIELPIQNPFAVYAAGMHGGAPPTMRPWQLALYPFIVIGQSLAGSYFMSGWMRMAIAAMRRQNVQISDAFSGWPSMLRVFGYSMVQSVCMLIACGGPIAALVFCMMNHGKLAVTIAVSTVAVVVFLTALVVSTFTMAGLTLVVDGSPVFAAFKAVFTTMRPHYGAVLGADALLVIMLLLAPCTVGLAYFALVPMWCILQALIGRDTLGISGPETLPPDWLPPGSEADPGAWPPPPTV